jgi:hypothetical protein
MTTNSSETLALATRLFVRLRHNAGRTTDVIWMTQNVDYAREVLKIARAHPDIELQKLAERFDELIFGAKPRVSVVATDNYEPGVEIGISGRYTGALR